MVRLRIMLLIFMRLTAGRDNLVRLYDWDIPYTLLPFPLFYLVFNLSYLPDISQIHTHLVVLVVFVLLFFIFQICKYLVKYKKVKQVKPLCKVWSVVSNTDH